SCGERARKVGRKIGSAAISVIVVADRIADGGPGDRQYAVRQRDVVVGGQAGTVGDRAGDGGSADVGGGGVAGAAVGDRQILAVDSRGECGRQVGRKIGNAAIGVAVVADRIADGRLVDRQYAVR